MFDVVNYRLPSSFVISNLFQFYFMLIQKWFRELDSRLPGQLGEVGAWLHKAEAVIGEAEYDDDVSDDEVIADVIKQQLDEHKVRFDHRRL